MSNPSVMILVKNEEYFLPFVLTQTEGHFDSFVLYDIGSTDGTRRIIDWWVKRMEGRADIFVRYLPHIPPEAQGACRNSMIVEGDRDIYFILDGDELYTPDHMAAMRPHAEILLAENEKDPRKRYGVLRRIELSSDLTHRYKLKRTHHRLYTKDAWWTGTHPGERAVHKQNDKSEVVYDITSPICWHLHNTLRSPKEGDALKRLVRKQQGTYHPGSEMEPFNLLKELPILQKPIEDFPVSPALAKLQEEYNGE